MVRRNKNKLVVSGSFKKGDKRNKLLRGIVVTGIFLIILLLALIFYAFGAFEQPKEQQLFSIIDECSLVMGNIIHNIKDSGDCLVRCRNECGLRELSFESSLFEARNSSCHSCSCYCL